MKISFVMEDWRAVFSLVLVDLGIGIYFARVFTSCFSHILQRNTTDFSCFFCAALIQRRPLLNFGGLWGGVNSREALIQGRL